MRILLSLGPLLRSFRAPVAVLATFAAAGSLVGCVGDDSNPAVPDAGTAVDASKGTDGSVATAGGTQADAATATDTGTGTDSAAPSDTGTPGDSGGEAE